MTRSKKALAAIVSTVLMLSGPVMAGQGKQAQKSIGAITAAAPLPVDRLVFIETDKGDRAIVSENGRFAIVGDFKLVDTWTLDQIRTVSDVQKMKFIPTAKIDEALPKAAHFSIGKGKRKLYVFLDLSDKNNEPLLQQITPELLKEYTVNLIFFPATTSDVSAQVNRKAWCGNRSQAASVIFSKFTQETKNEKILSFDGAQCDGQPLINSALLAKTILIKQVPYVINDHGKGAPNPRNLEEFLDEK